MAPVGPEPEVLRSLRVGILGGYFAQDLHPDVARMMEKALKELEDAGAEVFEMEIPSVEESLACGFDVVVPEAWILIQERLEEVAPGTRLEDRLEVLGPDVRAVFQGAAEAPVPATRYLQALRKTRRRIRENFREAFQKADVLLAPTTPSPAVPLEKHVQMDLNGQPVDTFLTFIRHTVPANVAGFPALSMPFDLSKEGLPLGLQWMGPWEKERDLLRWAWAFSRLRE